MGRRRSLRMETPLRRSSRLRNIRPGAEDTEETDKDTPEDQSEGDEELSAQVNGTEMPSSIPSESNTDSTDQTTSQEYLTRLGIASPGYFTVDLTRVKIDEDPLAEGDTEAMGDKKEDGGKEDPRKAGKPATSRIPTFQSTSGRKRTTEKAAEPVAQPPARVESPSLPAQPRAKGGSGSGSSKLKGPGGRETALPLPLARLPIGSSDIPSQIPSAPLDVPLLTHERSHSPILIPPSAAEPPKPDPVAIAARPAIRSEPRPDVSYLLSEAAQEVTAQPEITSRGPPTPSGDEQEEEELVAEEEVAMDSSPPPLPDEDIDAEENREESEALDEEEEKEEEEAVEEKMEPLKLEESGETGESDEESVLESNLQETGPSPSLNGAELQSLEKTREPHVELGLKEAAGFDLKHEVRGGDKGLKSSRGEAVPEARSRRSPVLKTGVGEAQILSDQPLSRSLKKPQPSSKSCGRCCPLLFLLSIALLLCGAGLHLRRYGTPAFTLVESIPEGLHFDEGSPLLPSISQAWTRLLSKANRTVDIAAYYFTLRASDQGLTDESSRQGEQVFDQLMKLQSQGIKLQIAVNAPQKDTQDTTDLNATGAEVRQVNLQNVTGGIVHTKLWVVDNKHVYLGSANMDWRSLTQVKEVGVSVENCSCLARDVSRVFGVYWHMGSPEEGSLPPYWPARYSALSSSEHPLRLKLNGIPAHVYLSSAPPQLSGYGRTGDLSAILSIISDAQKFIFISVMDYLPFSEFTDTPRFWPVIDSALRSAACARGVDVNLLVSCWPHSSGSMFVFLQSLLVLNQHPLSCKIHVKVFEVSSTPEQLKIPYARVNHAKYMVTDRVAYIGTSNWSENYFTQTAGVGLVVNQTGVELSKGQKTVQSHLQEIFLRDWRSQHAQDLSPEHVNRCGKHA
ncbi:hypothetical protein JZ751_006614 [Albula glossodonta]|uniref:PLD phosphodiesterase domain-containing protein n=1 Tax=Albula glossodonta TaxID=121402 RepID=A0A8T2NYY0_9TELE|nr:hypothetical protein JZ751_006614 [Albula glossodonta]